MENINHNRIKAIITAVILAVAMMITLLPSDVFAEDMSGSGDVVTAQYFDKDIVINGQSVPADKLADPVIVSGGYIYIPLDATFGSLLGISAELDSETATVNITQTEAQQKDFSDSQQNGMSGTVRMLAVKDITVTFTSSDGNTVTLDMSDSPVLYNGTTVYIAISPVLESGAAGWEASYSDETGLSLTTSTASTASTASQSVSSSSSSVQLSSSDASALVSYIRNVNSSVSEADAEAMVAAFYKYGQEYGIDPLLLMATAQCESTFNKSETNSYGCIGLMQISKSTGAGYGFSASELLQIDSNVHAAAAIMADNFSSFSNAQQAISAYCYGKGNVSRGTYKLGYYNNVMNKYNAISAVI
ncbi:MAG: transglycosylase SLT domain-containing protein [Anaerovoracaceae bacterium]